MPIAFAGELVSAATLPRKRLMKTSAGCSPQLANELEEEADKIDADEARDRSP